ncbi:MAG: YbaN family protein [Nitrososphaerota archaeon]|jgi:uncharacterized membrane protein YbaN (DUF454 family)|nr:YbaN family protein [Nitrososphaerota archaeon]
MDNSPQLVPSKIKKQKAVRILLFIAGSISLGLGAIGIFLPLLPTTPFLLLTAACYMRSSKRMHKWLLNNRWFGEYIKNYQAGRGIPLKTKIIAITILWITILFSVFFMLSEILILQVVLIAIAVVVSLHLIRLPTFKKQT